MMLRLLVLMTFFFSVYAQAKSIVPPFEKIKTKNGVEVFFFPSPNLPLFQVEVAFDGGARIDSGGSLGAVSVVSSMVEKGLPGLDENTISEKLDYLASGIDFNVGNERTSGSAFGLNEHVDPILHFFFQMMSSATFPEKPFLRIRANRIDGLNQLQDSPGALSGHVMSSILFNGTILGKPLYGRKEDLTRLQLPVLKKLYPDLFRTDQMKVLVIGGKTRAEILDKVISKIESLPCGSCGKPIPRLEPWSNPKWEFPVQKILLVKRSGISEAHVSMGFLGPKRKVAEFYGLRVAETILSGHFGSRLNAQIREKLNLTYSIDGGFDFGTEMGAFRVSSATRNEKVGELIVEIRKLLGDFVNGPIAEEEIKMAKDYLIGSFPMGLQNIYVIAGSYFQGLLNGLPTDFLDVFRERIRKVDTKSLKEAIAKHFHLDQMKTVVVGDPKAIQPRLLEKGLKFELKEPKEFL